MPRKYIKRFIPDRHKLKERWYLRPFSALLHDPVLLHVNRHNTCKAFALGLFCAFIPVPFQTVLVALGAIWLRVNLPVAIAAVFVTNPFTMGPIYYSCYKVGAWILDVPEQRFTFALSFEWLTEELLRIWQPFLLGSLVLGVITATVGYFTLNLIWQLYVMRKYRRRRSP